MIVLGAIVILLVAYWVVCHCTPLRYVRPFSYIEKSWCRGNEKWEVIFHLKRDRYFFLGVKYENILDYPITYDENGTGTYTNYKIYRIGLTWFEVIIRQKVN